LPWKLKTDSGVINASRIQRYLRYERLWDESVLLRGHR
jgi:hypothetical protein